MIPANKWKKFIKRPVEISAQQYKSMRNPPEGVCFCNDVPLGGLPHCHTLEGHHVVSDGDWIIRGVKGEFYPCKPDIFAMTYSLAGQTRSGSDLGIKPTGPGGGSIIFKTETTTQPTNQLFGNPK